VDRCHKSRESKDTIIPEDLVPKHPETGHAMRPNPFDNQFIKIGSSMKEDSKDQIRPSTGPDH